MQINKSVEYISHLVNGTLTTSDNIIIQKIASLEAATSQDLAIILDKQEGSVFDPLPLEIIQKSNAGLLLASSPIIPGKPYLIVDDPLKAFELLVKDCEKSFSIADNEYLMHPTSQVDSSSTIEAQTILEPHVVVDAYSHIKNNSFVGTGSFIGKNCTIGSHVTIHPHATILDGTIIGDYSVIHSGAVIGSDGFGYHVGQQSLRKIPHVGVVHLGKNVEIGANTTIDRAQFEATSIGDGTKIDNQVHIAHNVKVGAHCAILAQTIIGGSAIIGNGCQIGGHVAIKDHITIGHGAKIVSKSGVMKDVMDGEIIAGTPAVAFSKWKRINAALMQLPELIKEARAQGFSPNSPRSWIKHLLKL